MRRIMQIAGVAALVVGVTPAQAQERVYHPFHVPAGHNWTFRAEYPAADRLFNAFDYGHGILYETLWSRPDAPVSLLEEEIFHRLTREILLNPPRLPMPEASFMPRYARLVPRAKEMFEWAHILHRQSYDVLADRSLSRAEQDRAMAELLRVYRSSDLAFPVEPKGMEIMDDQYFSKVFRERYPRFNGLIWAYHWLQVAIYEPLLVHDTPEERQAAIHGTLAALLADGGGGAGDPPVRDADDAGHRPGLHRALPGVRGHLRQPAHDARRDLGHPGIGGGGPGGQATGDLPADGSLPGSLGDGHLRGGVDRHGAGPRGGCPGRPRHGVAAGGAHPGSGGTRPARGPRRGGRAGPPCRARACPGRAGSRRAGACRASRGTPSGSGR
jgi:hypothetical protein